MLSWVTSLASVDTTRLLNAEVQVVPQVKLYIKLLKRRNKVVTYDGFCTGRGRFPCKYFFLFLYRIHWTFMAGGDVIDNER